MLLGDKAMSGTKLSGFALSFLLCLGAIAQAAAPKVVKTVPKAGASDVDPGLKFIEVVFDQDMTTGQQYSIVGGGPKFPTIIGKPRWRNKRTIVMRVRLEPNHEYWLSINSDTYKNFISVDGEPAVPYPISFKTASDKGSDKSETLPTAANQDALKELRSAIDKYYSYRDVRQVDWDDLFGKYENRLRDAKTALQFATVAAEMLANAKDKHIWLDVDGQHVPTYVRPVSPNADFKKLPKFIPGFQKIAKTICVGKFDDGIGYILIDTWSNERREDIEEVFEAIWEFADAPGLIMDVRGNDGGAEPLAREIAGCFVNKPVVYAKHVVRDPSEESGFSKVYDRVLQPNKKRPRYRGKVAVLTGPVVISSGEAFLLMMKQVPGCKLVGACSQGSSGNPKPYNLGNGVTVFLPSWKAMRPDGSCFETEGIEPDIPVETNASSFENEDPVIEAALRYLHSE